MNEAIQHFFAYWLNRLKEPVFAESLDYTHPLVSISGALVVYLVFRLARSVEVSESGKVSTVYHSPRTWLARFNDQVEDNRSNYSARQRSFLSFLHRGKNYTEAFSILLLGLILTGVGGVLVYAEPNSIVEPTTAGFLLIGLLLIAYAWRRFRRTKPEDPYTMQDTDPP